MVAMLSLALFAASIPAYYDSLINFAGQHSGSATLRANLQELGISVDFYATFELWMRGASAMAWVGWSIT